MNRKILYGYQIQDGELTAHPKEAECVQRIFSLYLSGMAQHQIADTLNAEGLPYSAESPAWSRPRVMQTIRNSRYMGEKGYPTLVDDKTFCAAQAMRAKRVRKWGDHPALCLVKKLRCGQCGHSLRRLAQSQWKHTLRFHCDGCGMSVTIPDADLLSEVERQAAEYTPSADAPGYAPSEDSVRLTNAINRGLEKPEHPEEVTALIMHGISARYACFPTQMTATDILRLIREKDYDQAIRYITITADNAVTVTFR